MQYLSISTSFEVEIFCAIVAIETTYEKQWYSLWLECDLALVIEALQNNNLVPWKLRIKWANCVHITKSFPFKATHIFRGRNCVVQTLSLPLRV